MMLTKSLRHKFGRNKDILVLVRKIDVNTRALAKVASASYHIAEVGEGAATQLVHAITALIAERRLFKAELERLLALQKTSKEQPQ